MNDGQDLLFAGLKVLDVGSWIAGPVAATMLPDVMEHRETAGGGLAATPTGRRLAKERLVQIKRADG